MKKLILLIIPILFLTGCNYMELNDLAIASSIGIDYDNENNLYNITTQIMNVKSGDSGASEESTIIYEADGKTISEAINDFSIRYPRNVYLGHLEMCVLGRDAVNNKMSNIFDYFLRNSETSSSCYVLIANNKKAREILNPKNEKSENFPAEDLKSVLIDGTNNTGTINKIEFDELLSYVLQKGIDPVVPTVDIVKNHKNSASSTKISGMTTIHKEKVKNNMSKNASIAFNTIKENYDEITIYIKYKDDYVSFNITNPKGDIKPKIKNNKVSFDIDINLESKVSEIDKKIELKNHKNQDYFENEINKTFKKYINELITYSKDNNVDPIGLKNLIYKNYYKEYKKYKNKNIYEISKINIKVNNEMYVHGTINKGAL